MAAEASCVPQIPKPYSATRLPRKIEQYTVGDLLGQGTFATCRTVSLVRNERREVYACRTVPKLVVRQCKFMRETRILQSVRHVNIVQIYEFFSDATNYYQILDHCSGGNLKEILKGRSIKHFEDPDARSLFVQILEGVAFLHLSQILHRDLKSQNVCLTTTQIPKIGDFGTAVRLMEGQVLVEEKVGTPSYMAPEVVEVDPEVGYSFPADVFSLGCLFYELLAGRSPFFASNNAEAAYKAILGSDSSTMEFPNCDIAGNPIHIPSTSRHLIKMMLQRNATDRPSTEVILRQLRTLGSLPDFVP